MEKNNCWCKTQKGGDPTFWATCVAGHRDIYEKKKTNDRNQIYCWETLGPWRWRNSFSHRQNTKRTVTVSKAWLRHATMSKRLIQATWVDRPRRLQASKQPYWAYNFVVVLFLLKRRNNFLLVFQGVQSATAMKLWLVLDSQLQISLIIKSVWVN